MPRLAEMVKMIRIGAKYLSRMYPKDSAQMRQLRFVALSFQNLPTAVVSEYRSLWERCGDQPPLDASEGDDGLRSGGRGSSVGSLFLSTDETAPRGSSVE